MERTLENITINGAMLKDMFLTGAALLEKNKAHIDSLNVFPVPDGDTGTNMSMTMQSAAREIKACAGTRVCDVAAAASLGSLKGARGNSGVILSQIFRGFSRALDDAEEMDGAMLAAALKTGTEAAYKAVMKPKEGTMLTVSRMIGEAVAERCAAGANVYKLMDVIIERGEIALKLTPDLLPVLKEAGVVDSGGKGLLTIFRGFKMALDGEEIDDYAEEALSEAPSEDVLTLDDVNDIKFGYCTEFFIIHLDESFSEEELDRFREKLTRIGDSVVVAYDSDFIKVHVHSNAPGKILQLALRLGEINKLKVDNMREQNRELQENLKKSEKESAMVAVSTGKGIDAIFTDLGVDAIIEGGQTMNPSIDTIAKAIRRVNARNVFVLPNNSNIIMAAQQAAELSERNVIVLPTKTVVQGISAATAYIAEDSVADIQARMQKALEHVLSGSVTYAVRDTSVNGNKIEKGNIIGLLGSDIVAVGNNIEEATLKLLDIMMERQGKDSIITVLYGENVDADNAAMLVEQMQDKYPRAEILAQEGGQPLYYYYISVE
ncbi:MAG: DAK2 domain-containing protein [Christensenellaceae bacterium]|nr:DAK2 domain-containing protein [Christensenellaceae bacterium]